jgi:hypothetical protein
VNQPAIGREVKQRVNLLLKRHEIGTNCALNLRTVNRKEMLMAKRALLTGLLVILIALPLTAMGGEIPAKVYESGSDNSPVAVAGVTVQVFGGFGHKALLASGLSGKDGGVVLGNVPTGKEVVVKLSKAGYVTQYDVRSFSDGNKGSILWIGSEANVTGLYKNLGETFDSKKGQVYLEIINELTGEGIDGIQIAASSGKAFDLGHGEYLIANAEGASLKVAIRKPGYAFDVESATISLFPGAMTQAYVTVQSGGAVVESGQATKVTSAMISGYILRLSDSKPISGVTVAFTQAGKPSRASVLTDKLGFYKQTQFPVNKVYKVIPSKPPWKFRPATKSLFVGVNGGKADFKGY